MYSYNCFFAFISRVLKIGTFCLSLYLLISVGSQEVVPRASFLCFL